MPNIIYIKLTSHYPNKHYFDKLKLTKRKSWLPENFIGQFSTKTLKHM